MQLVKSKDFGSQSAHVELVEKGTFEALTKKHKGIKTHNAIYTYKPTTPCSVIRVLRGSNEGQLALLPSRSLEPVKE